MAQQTISVGAVANDKTGDQIRTAFTKVNANFTELYTSAVGSSTPNKINVLDHGAMGDGSTDDSDGINAAIDASYSVLYIGYPNSSVFPPWLYRYVTQHATMRYPVSLIGEGHLKQLSR